MSYTERLHGTKDRTNHNRHGLVRYNDEDGSIVECSYLNGQPHGLSITYTEVNVWVRFYQYGQKKARFVFNPDTFKEEFRQVWEVVDDATQTTRWLNVNEHKAANSTNKRWLKDLHPIDFKPSHRSRIFKDRTHWPRKSLIEEVDCLLNTAPSKNEEVWNKL